ncbi:MAG: sugar transferase [Chloroflexi bacterium]|nr:sugar transferase [Chloroflexota bacterium]
MITSKPQIVGSALRPTVATQVQMPKTQVLVPPAKTATLYRVSKRSFDLIVACMLLVLLSPLYLLIFFAIKLDDRGPVLIVQNRVGLGGKVYNFYKFRSMTVGVNHMDEHRAFAQHVIRGEITKGPQSNGGLLKPTGDGRAITRVGRVLRRTSLDELPQIFNVIIGNMSLVGPRPSMDYEVEAYYDWYLPRLSVLPGITGLAQINGRSSIPFPEIVSWDLQYIEKRSCTYDLRILYKTLPVVASMSDTG